MDPWDFHGAGIGSLRDVDDYIIEVRKNGAPLVAPKPNLWSAVYELKLLGCMRGFGFESLPSRFPLHLAYRLDSPGVYSIRLTGSQGSEVVVQSAWIDIEIKACPGSTRNAWLRTMAEKTKSAGARDLIRDIVPSLLAWPDERALAVLLPVYSTWLRHRRLVNLDLFVVGFLRNSLAAFDDDVLRRVIRASILSELCPPQGRCKVPMRP